MCNKKAIKKTPLFQEQQKQKVYDTNPCVICQLLAFKFHEKDAVKMGVGRKGAKPELNKGVEVCV